MSNAADVIAKRLYEAGCRKAYGIPGGEVLTLIDALANAGIDFVLAKHENTAGFMAEGTFHATGALGVLVATIGPGVANATNVVANALQDRVPLIFLTGCVDAADASTYTHQVFDHCALLKPITKASFTATHGAVDVLIDKAVAIALDGQPGPVHVDVPIGVAAAEQPDRPAVCRARPSPAAPAAGSDLDTARSWLSSAERPLMIAGVDVLSHGAADVVADFARSFQIPLITTYKAKGVLPEDHPLSLGGAGLSPKADELLMDLVATSDLIVLAGYDPIEMRTGWRDPWSADANVIEFSAVANTHYMHQARLSFIGDVGAGLTTLGSGSTPSATWSNAEYASIRRALRQAFSAGSEWGPAAVIATARQTLPRDTVATVDSGAHRILLSQMWECYAPQTLLQSTGLCTMGCALPLGMGFKLVEPERPVAVFVGDAGLEMVLGELATARDLKLPVVVVVFVDESLALIEAKQRRSGYDNRGVDFGGTDFPAIAEAMGGYGALVDNRNDLAREIQQALTRSTFSVIACDIGTKAYDGKF